MDIETAKDAGNAAFKGGLWLQALMRYSEAIAYEGPTSLKSILHSNRAAVLLILKDHALALEECTLALELDQTNKKALFRRATAKEGLNDKIGAIEDLELLIALDPVDADTVCARLSGLRGIISPPEASSSRDIIPVLEAASRRGARGKRNGAEPPKQTTTVDKGKGRAIDDFTDDLLSNGKQTNGKQPIAAPMHSRSTSASSSLPAAPTDMTDALSLRESHDKLRSAWARDKAKLVAKCVRSSVE